jgi:hypothetical protein
MEDNCDLDTSWIEKYQHHELVREPMDKVRVYLLYIHSNMSIDKIVQEDIPLETLASKSGQGVSKEVLLKIIHDGKPQYPIKNTN